MNLLAHHGQNSVFAEPLIIRNILLDPEGRDNIVGCRADVVGGVEPYTYLWTELSGDDTFITGTGGVLPAGSTEGDSITSTEEIGWHSSINTTATSPYDVRCQITDAVGTVVSVDFQVVDDAPNYVTFAKTSTVEYDEEVVYTIVSDANYTYAWVLPEYARLTAGTVSDNEITIVWDDAVSLEDRDVDLVCTVTADPANPQAVYSVVTETVTVSGVLSSSLRAEWPFDSTDYVSESSGTVSSVADRNGVYDLTAVATKEPTWTGSQVSFDGDEYMENTSWNYDPDAITVIIVTTKDDTGESLNVPWQHGEEFNAAIGPFIYNTYNATELSRFAVFSDASPANGFTLSATAGANKHVSICVMDRLTDSHYVNVNGDSEVTSSNEFNAEGFNSTRFNVGNLYGSSAWLTTAEYSGDIHYLAVYDGRVSDTERDNIFERLKTHYGIS